MKKNKEITVDIIKKISEEMLEILPDFKQFNNDNNEKTLEELAMEYDLNIELLKSLLE